MGRKQASYSTAWLKCFASRESRIPEKSAGEGPFLSPPANLQCSKNHIKTSVIGKWNVMYQTPCAAYVPLTLQDYNSIQRMFEVTLYLTYYKTKKKNKKASYHFQVAERARVTILGCKSGVGSPSLHLVVLLCATSLRSPYPRVSLLSNLHYFLKDSSLHFLVSLESLLVEAMSPSLVWAAWGP